MTTTWQAALARLAAGCRPAGIDLAAPLRLGWYDQAVPPEARVGGDAARLAVVLGSTRALWSAFGAALAEDRALAEGPHPLDGFVASAVRQAAAALDLAWDARFSHERPPRCPAIQRAAHVAGLAHLSPSRLSVHPRYGPWLRLNALLVVDVEGPTDRPAELARPCPDCEHACLPRLDAAVARSGERLPADPDRTLADELVAWLAVRDSCPVGREHRYDDDQIRYGYTKDRAILRRLASR